MRKTIMMIMAAVMMLTAGTALAAVSGKDYRDDAPCYETNNNYCGRYYERGQGRYRDRGGYGCGYNRYANNQN